MEEPQRPAARKALRQANRTGRVGAASWRVHGNGQRPFEIALQPRPLAGLERPPALCPRRKGQAANAMALCNARPCSPR